MSFAKFKFNRWLFCELKSIWFVSMIRLDSIYLICVDSFLKEPMRHDIWITFLKHWNFEYCYQLEKSKLRWLDLPGIFNRSYSIRCKLLTWLLIWFHGVQPSHPKDYKCQKQFLKNGRLFLKIDELDQQLVHLIKTKINQN